MSILNKVHKVTWRKKNSADISIKRLWARAPTRRRGTIEARRTVHFSEITRFWRRKIGPWASGIFHSLARRTSASVAKGEALAQAPDVLFGEELVRECLCFDGSSFKQSTLRSRMGSSGSKSEYSRALSTLQVFLRIFFQKIGYSREASRRGTEYSIFLTQTSYTEISASDSFGVLSESSSWSGAKECIHALESATTREKETLKVAWFVFPNLFSNCDLAVTSSILSSTRWSTPFSS